MKSDNNPNSFTPKSTTSSSSHLKKSNTQFIPTLTLNKTSPLKSDDPFGHSLTTQKQLSMPSTASPSKFQFDLNIQQVELSVPSPITIYVQWMKGNNVVNTKKKLRIDQINKVAKFNEKVTLVTTLNKLTDYNVNSNGPMYAHKLVHLKLFAIYNGKDKAIGVISFDLASYTAKNMDRPQKLTFSKCFDKNANISFQMKCKELFTSIQETVSEECVLTELSQLDENEIYQEEHSREDEGRVQLTNDDICDTSRFSMLNSARENLNIDTDSQKQQQFSDLVSREERDYNGSQKMTPIDMNKNAFSKTSVFSSSNSKQNSNSNNKPMHSARVLNIGTSSSDAMSESTPRQIVSNFDDNKIKRLEEKIKKMEAEVQYLRKENSEQQDKIVQYQIKNERLKDYEAKCNESEAYKQKCSILEEQLRRMQQENDTYEIERSSISDLYERKNKEFEQQMKNQQNQISHQQQKIQTLTQQLQLSQQQYILTTNEEGSTQADDDQCQKSPFKIRDEILNNQKEDTTFMQKCQQVPRDDFEKVLEKLRFVTDENAGLKFKTEQLEKHVINSKEQVVSLMNELYSMEKEQIQNQCYEQQ